MTVTYTNELATTRSLTIFKLFFKWKGSVLKLLWKELIVYVIIFYIIQLIYVFGLDESWKAYFEKVVRNAKNYEDVRTLSFVLGFFVTTIMTRWWSQFLTIPWPYSISVYVSSTLQGYDEVGRAMRRTILRYVNLSQVMVFRVLSPRVRKRFPKMDDLIDAGLINENELYILQDLDRKYPTYGKNWLPICWAANLAIRARNDGRIKDDFSLKTIIEELNSFRGRCGLLLSYDRICIPLVYIQVVTIAVYSFLITSMISLQPIHKTQIVDGKVVRETNDFYVLQSLPFSLILQFIFYMGWLKVAETMINPFGEDDDDFDINSMIDRNLIMSYLIVEEMHNEHPELLKDQYWNEVPKQLPDIGRDVKKESEVNLHQNDIFDVVDSTRASNIFRRRTFSIPADTFEEPEKPEAVSVSVSKSDLKPRSDVIDSTYRRLTGVELTQSMLEKKMAKIRKQATAIDESDTDDESIIDLEKL